MSIFERDVNAPARLGVAGGSSAARGLAPLTPALRCRARELASLALLALLVPAPAAAEGAYLLPTVAGAEGGMLELNVTTLIQAVSYIVFILAMNAIVYRPILEHLDRRNEVAKEADEKSEVASEKARAADERREEELSDAYAEASRARAKVKADAVDEYQKVVHDARAEADRTVQAARDRFDEEASKAEEALAPQVDELAGLIREKLLADAAKGGEA